VQNRLTENYDRWQGSIKNTITAFTSISIIDTTFKHDKKSTIKNFEDYINYCMP